MGAPATGRTPALQLVALSHTNVLGGAERILVRTLALARDDGWRVACVCPPGDLAELLQEKGVDHWPGPDARRHGPGVRDLAALASRWVAGASRLGELLAPADVILANGLRSLPALRLARPRAPVAWWVHDVVEVGPLRQLCRVCSPVVDEALAVSLAAARLPQGLGLPTTVVHHGTPWPIEPGPDISERAAVIGSAAVLSPWKGQMVLLEAVARLRRPGVTVELLGSAPPKDRDFPGLLQRRARELGIADRVELVGQVPQAVEHMRRWSVMALPSTDPEAWPLVALEAMSVGTPIVASDHGGPAELLPEIGLLVPPGDPARLAAALDELLEDHDLWRRCRAAGITKVERDLTFEGQARTLLAELQSLARRGRRRQAAGRRPALAHRPLARRLS